MAKDANISADDLIAIPDDEIQLGFDKDGMPKAEATAKPATGKPIEDEDKAPVISAAVLEDARREATEARRQAELERQAREKAEKDSAANTDIALKAHWRSVNADYTATNADYQAVASGIGQTKALQEALRRDLKAARESGDIDRETEVLDQQAKAAAELVMLQNGEAQLRARLADAKNVVEDTAQRLQAIREAPKPEPQQPQQRQLSADEWIATHPRKTQAWLREHKEYVTDPAKHQELQTFANEWVADYGQHTMHSPQFLAELNARFSPEASEEPGEHEEIVVAEEVARPTPKPKSRATPAAPVSRRGSEFSSQNMNAKAVRLPPKLAKFVKESGLDPTQYALGAVADIKAGKLPKNFLDQDYDHTF